jgi:hypothetical protein
MFQPARLETARQQLDARGLSEPLLAGPWLARGPDPLAVALLCSVIGAWAIGPGACCAGACETTLGVCACAEGDADVDVDEARVVAAGLTRAVREGKAGFGECEVSKKPATNMASRARSAFGDEMVGAEPWVGDPEAKDERPEESDLSRAFTVPAEDPASLEPGCRPPSQLRSVPAWDVSNSLSTADALEGAETVRAPCRTSVGMTPTRSSYVVARALPRARGT